MARYASTFVTRHPDGASGPSVADSLERAAGPMAVPKRKMSRSNTRARRSQWKTEAVDLVPVRVRGRSVSVPRRLARAVERGLVEVD